MAANFISPPVATVLLNESFTTTSPTPQATELVAPAGPSVTYVIEGAILVRSADPAVDVHVGIAWPDGCLDGVAEIVTDAGRTIGNLGAPVAAVASLLDDGSWPVTVRATFVTGVYAEGALAVTLASADGATEVTAAAGSWLRVWALG